MTEDSARVFTSQRYIFFYSPSYASQMCTQYTDTASFVASQRYPVLLEDHSLEEQERRDVRVKTQKWAWPRENIYVIVY